MGRPLEGCVRAIGGRLPQGARDLRRQVPQASHLGQALGQGVVGQMGGDQAHRPAIAPGIDHDLDRHPGHPRDARIGRIGQNVVKHLQQGQAREDHVAELAPPVRSAARPVEPGAVDRLMVGKGHGQGHRLIGARAIVELPAMARDLLQADHVGIAEGLDVGDDAGQIEPAVAAGAALYVPGQNFHGRQSSLVGRNRARQSHARGVDRHSSRRRLFQDQSRGCPDPAGPGRAPQVRDLRITRLPHVARTTRAIGRPDTK